MPLNSASAHFLECWCIWGLLVPLLTFTTSPSPSELLEPVSRPSLMVHILWPVTGTSEPVRGMSFFWMGNVCVIRTQVWGQLWSTWAQGGHVFVETDLCSPRLASNSTCYILFSKCPSFPVLSILLFPIKPPLAPATWIDSTHLSSLILAWTFPHTLSLSSSRTWAFTVLPLVIGTQWLIPCISSQELGTSGVQGTVFYLSESQGPVLCCMVGT